MGSTLYGSASFGLTPEEEDDAKHRFWSSLGQSIMGAALTGNWREGGLILGKAMPSAMEDYDKRRLLLRGIETKNKEQAWEEEQHSRTRIEQEREDRRYQDSENDRSRLPSQIKAERQKTLDAIHADDDFKRMPPEKQAQADAEISGQFDDAEAGMGSDPESMRSTLAKVISIGNAARNSFGTVVGEQQQVRQDEESRASEYYKDTGVHPSGPDDPAYKKWIADDAAERTRQKRARIEHDEAQAAYDREHAAEMRAQTEMQNEVMKQGLVDGTYVPGPAGKPVPNPLLKQQPKLAAGIEKFKAGEGYLQFYAAMESGDPTKIDEARQAVKMSPGYQTIKNSYGINVDTPDGRALLMRLTDTEVVRKITTNKAVGHPTWEGYEDEQQIPPPPEGKPDPRMVAGDIQKVIAVAAGVGRKLDKGVPVVILMKLKKSNLPVNDQTILFALAAMGQ